MRMDHDEELLVGIHSVPGRREGDQIGSRAMSESIRITATDAKVIVGILGGLEAQLADETSPDPLGSLLARLPRDFRRYGLSPAAGQDREALAAMTQRLHAELGDVHDAS
jgi:hypothetical protein